MKRVFLIHGWRGRPGGGWRPWLKKELTKRRFEVFVPAMPDSNRPKARVWVKHLAKIVGEPDKNCFFVGHSLGCITILRYLERLNEKQRVGGAVLVAGFADDLGCRELRSFFAKPIAWKKIRKRCKKFVAIHSDDDAYVPLKHGTTFRRKLGARLIVKSGMKHFAGHEGITRVPVVLEAILRMARVK